MAEPNAASQGPNIQVPGSTLINNITSLSVARQISLVIALAATVALAIGIIMWSSTAKQALLFGSMDAKDITEVMQILEQDKIPYKVEAASGAITVPADQVAALRLKLAAQGYPKQAPSGYQLLDVDQGFGISQFKETTRYHRALEGELAKSVASINSVREARVMLGLPKRSVFVRKEQQPTASVVVKLYAGRSLREEQVSAIVALVSASVPNMKPSDVSVVDQNGNLLTTNNQLGMMNMSMKQLDYTQMVENTLSDRIINLLAPIVGGSHKVRAQVTAELDFTQQEQTRENFEPDPEAVRSEQQVKEIDRNDGPVGVPGALTNQPPRAGIAPEEGFGSLTDPNLKSSKEKRTKNYELDRTVSHTKNSIGSIRRLSVAVVVDDKLSTDDNGEVTRTPLSPEDLQSYRQLVADAVGLDENRGDTLTVVNASFVQEKQAVYEDAQLWEMPWFWDVVKQVLGGLAILLLIFGVLRPMLKDLSKKEETYLDYPEDVAEDEDDESLENADEISKALEKMNTQVQDAVDLEAEKAAEEKRLIEKVKAVIESDPKLAAHIIKQWLSGGKK